jgi:L-ornithine N5-oxygenase
MSPTEFSFANGISKAGVPHEHLELHLPQSSSGSEKSLSETPFTSTFDVVVAGFGPAALAFAIAIQDSLDNPGVSGINFENKIPKVAFLEKKSRFSWHSGMLVDGAKMQISFIKDLATLRNPRSRFTFLHYLFEKNRLVQFSNLSTFLPSRLEFEDYQRWCAGHFKNVAHYGQEVVEILPEANSPDNKTTSHFIVRSQNVVTKEISVLRTRHVIVAIGGKPRLPSPFQSLQYSAINHSSGKQERPLIIHSSQYTHTLPLIPSIRHLMPSTSTQPPRMVRRIAIIGSGQSAGEIFLDLASRFPDNSGSVYNASTELHLLFRGDFLKPADDSPFVNQVFEPGRISGFFESKEKERKEQIRQLGNTNYGVIREELLTRMYELLYEQKVRDDGEKHSSQDNQDDENDGLRLKIVPGVNVLKADVKDNATVNLVVDCMRIPGFGEPDSIYGQM